MSTKDFIEKDYYKALGVAKDAKPDEIKRAYRKLAREHHPDANKGDAGSEAKFKDISEAYDVLSDSKRRAEYDEARSLFGSGRMPRGRSGPAGTSGPSGGGYSFDLGDIFGGAAGGGTSAGGLGDVLGGIFGGRGAGRTQPRRGVDVEADVNLGFTEAVEGTTVPLRMRSDKVCPVCHGTGGLNGEMPHECPTCHGSGQTARNQGGFAFSEPCPTCRGRGLVVDHDCTECHGSGRAVGTSVLNVRIPAGVRDGQRIRLKGKGTAGERGGPNGDLFVTVKVASHPLFGRKDDNLTLTVPITFPEAALGTDLRVPTLGGAPVTLKIPAGTASGRTFRVRGRGSVRKDGTRADLLVTVEVAVPKNLDTAAQQALEAFRTATAGEDPRAGLVDLAGGA